MSGFTPFIFVAATTWLAASALAAPTAYVSNENMAITPDGRKLYSAGGRSNTVPVVDTETNTKIAEIPVGELPWGVVIQ